MTVGSTNESNLSPFRAISTITRPFRARIGLFALCTFGVGLLEALFLVVVTRAALAIAGGETVVGVTRNVELTVNETALAGLGILLVRFVLYYLTARVQTGLQYRITAGYRKKLGGSFLASPWMKQSQQPPGFLQQVVVQFPSQIAALVGSMSNALSGGLALLALVGIALAINAVSTLLVFGALVVLAVILVPIARSIRRTSARALEHQVEFANRVSEVSDLSLEINAFGVREPVRKALNDLIDDEAASTRRVGLTSSLVSPIYMSLAYGAVLVGLLAINSFGANDINEVGAVMLIMMRCLGYGQQTQQGLTAIGQHTPYAERILATTRFFDADSAAPGDTHLVQLSRIEFEDVSFSYPGREASLMGVSFALAFGEVIGVVGPSGSGKTTLIQMLLGLLPPESGTIKVDGIPLSDVDLRDWNRIACYVPQEAKLLSGTIAENVRFYRTGISDEEVLRALRDANFFLDAERFPQSIDTDIGTSGRQLSGGQSQRLAIARALATNPTLLILDEPTSALDASSEEVIAETLGRLRGRVTTVVVSHRESTLEICDRRLLVSAGRVSYEPTHS